MSREHTCFISQVSARWAGTPADVLEDSSGHFKCPGNGIQMSGRMR